MKPKHYPHVTAAAAVLLLLLPVSLLLLIPGTSDPSAEEIIAEANRDTQKVEPARTASSVKSSVRPVEYRPATRVAMLPETATDQAGLLQSAEENLYSVAVQELSSADVPQVPDRDNTDFPVSSDHPEDTAITETTATDQSSNPAGPAIVKSRSVEEQTREDQLAKELDSTLAMGPSTRDTHFQSTGHLAMTGTPAAAKNTASHRSSRGAGSRSRSERQEEPSKPATTPTIVDEDPFASEPDSPIVDVIIQQPFEQRPVQKVENLIATTQQPGWPIALVRSDIPGDAWWVQQMVGIRHRSFASRVNFGNNDSLPGSVYHLVIVFLDSADEARRFRIAKQFTDIPEGLRRSREYTFVRK